VSPEPQTALPTALAPVMPCSEAFRIAVAIAVVVAYGLSAVLPRILPHQKPGRAVELLLEGLSRGSPALGSGGPACNYGGQPYYFVASEEATLFNVTPRTWDMRAFDRRCQPRQLVQKLLDVKTVGGRQLSILLYGDRCCITAWLCALQLGARHDLPQSLLDSAVRAVRRQQHQVPRVSSMLLRSNLALDVGHPDEPSAAVHPRRVCILMTSCSEAPS